MAPVATKRRFFSNVLVCVRVRARPPGDRCRFRRLVDAVIRPGEL
jgi:hypothetical protein